VSARERLVAEISTMRTPAVPKAAEEESSSASFSTLRDSSGMLSASAIWLLSSGPAHTAIVTRIGNTEVKNCPAIVIRPVEQLDANAVGQAADDDPAGPPRGRPFDRPAQPRREPVDDGRGAISIARHRPRRSIAAHHRFVTARESPATGHMAIARIPTGGRAQHHPA